MAGKRFSFAPNDAGQLGTFTLGGELKVGARRSGRPGAATLVIKNLHPYAADFPEIELGMGTHILGRGSDTVAPVWFIGTGRASRNHLEFEVQASGLIVAQDNSMKGTDFEPAYGALMHSVELAGQLPTTELPSP